MGSCYPASSFREKGQGVPAGLLTLLFSITRKEAGGSGQDSAPEFGVCLQPVPISGTARGRVIKPRTPASTS